MKFLKLSTLAIALLAASSAHADVIDFSTDMTARGNTTNVTANSATLTTTGSSQNGSIFTNDSFSSINNFTATFDIKIGGGSEADGLTFGWVVDPSATTQAGGFLGFKGFTGYAVEFDTFTNGWDDGDNNHVAVIENSPETTLTQTNISTFDINDDVTRSVVVEFNSGVISVDIDGTNFINDYTIAGYSAFDGYFGFTAATGGKNDNHLVSNFDLTVSAVPEPSTYALMLGGLGLVGFMAARRRKNA